jgi:excisionase family DNA binding protein
MTEKLLVSRKDAAEMLSVSLRVIDEMISSGKLPSKRIGGRRLFERSVLEKFAKGPGDESPAAVPPRRRKASA